MTKLSEALSKLDEIRMHPEAHAQLLLGALEHVRAGIERLVEDTDCATLDEHWFPDDGSGEIWTGAGDDVGECEGHGVCMVAKLYFAGLVEIKRLKRAPCDKGHEWYGETCGECAVDE